MYELVNECLHAHKYHKRRIEFGWITSWMRKLSAGMNSSWALNQCCSWSKEGVILPTTLQPSFSKQRNGVASIEPLYALEYWPRMVGAEAGKHFQFSSLAVVLLQSWWNWSNCPAVVLAPRWDWNRESTQPMKICSHSGNDESNWWRRGVSVKNVQLWKPKKIFTHFWLIMYYCVIKTS